MAEGNKKLKKFYIDQRNLLLVSHKINDVDFDEIKIRIERSELAKQMDLRVIQYIARLAIKPLRIAFDDIAMKDRFCKAVEIAHKHGIKEISNYMLFNFNDKPEDLYERLKTNIELNQRLGIQIFSFPMKYSPITETDRSYVGKHWSVKQLRAISAILQVTKGVVAAGTSFFYKAFGRDLNEFCEILSMPRDYIMFRSYFEENGRTYEWQREYRKLDTQQKEQLLKVVSLPASELRTLNWPNDLRAIIPFYLDKHPTGPLKTASDNQMTLFD